MFFLLSLAALQQNGSWNELHSVTGREPGGVFASTMAATGDLDHDGVSELVIGNFSSDIAGFNAGAVYVVSGRTGALLHSFFGEVEGGIFGEALDGAGDLDQDGYEDILVGAPHADYLGGSVSGAAYVYSGRDGHRLLRILSSVSSGYSGMGEGVSRLGDVNLDGHDDILVGEPEVARPGGSGYAWVYSGRDGSVLLRVGSVGDFGVGTVVRGISDVTGDGIPDFLTNIGGGVALYSGATGIEIRRHINLTPFAAFGEAMADLGDLDQDGVADYAIGAPAFASRDRGHVSVYSGATGDQRYYFEGDPDDKFGISVAGPGDVDGDGYPDLLVGASEDKNGDGTAHLFSGFDGQLLTSFHSKSPNSSYVGISVASPGDVDGDGLADFAIGSGWIVGGTGLGKVRVYALHSYLNLSHRSLSAAAGGAIDFTLDFTASEAHRKYGLLASTGAGRTRMDGLWLPLRRTPFLEQMIFAPPAAFSGARGRLDADGDAAATLTLAPHQAAPFLGRTIKFAAVSFEPGGGIGLFSAAMPLEIGP